jgi:lipoprotein NlpI
LGDYDRALADLDQAVKINPKSVRGYTTRADIYSGKGDNDRAIADYDEVIRLDPKNARGYNSRGNAYDVKGDYDRAIADYSEAIRINPKNGSAYLSRAVANLYAGALPKALADVTQVSALSPKSSYAALWLDIVGQRNDVPSNLQQTVANLDMTAWPAPVIRLFLGQMTPAAVLAAADDPDAVKKKRQLCEANFYSGELALRQHAKDGATRLFRITASDCPNTFIGRAANGELKALGVMRK